MRTDFRIIGMEARYTNHDCELNWEARALGFAATAHGCFLRFLEGPPSSASECQWLCEFHEFSFHWL